jgi:serine protease Do
MDKDFNMNENNNESLNKNIYVEGEIIPNTSNTYYEETNNGNSVIVDALPKKKRKVPKKFLSILSAACIFGVVAGASFQGFNYLANNNKTSIIGQNVNELDDISNKEGNDDVVTLPTNNQSGNVTSDVSSVVENVMPSIVAINSVVTNNVQDLFGRPYSEDVSGSGSGIIIGQNESEILIVTNNHVVADAKSLEVKFVNDKSVTATIKGTAPRSDLAVLSVNVNDLDEETIDKIKIATLGDSDSTKLGEMAIAIGNALGYGQSITVGYISALNREVTIDDVTLNVLQTDAAINPGNSGGALLNSKGEVIGINSVKYVDETVESIGYAIPISEAIPIINQLMNRETLAEKDQAYLGVGGRDVTTVDASRFNMPVGFYIGEVNKGSAAEAAGVKIGDILVGVNDTPVSSIEDLQEILSFTKAGSTGTLTVKTFENGEYVENTLSITFDAKPKTK